MKKDMKSTALKKRGNPEAHFELLDSKDRVRLRRLADEFRGIRADVEMEQLGRFTLLIAQLTFAIAGKTPRGKKILKRMGPDAIRFHFGNSAIFADATPEEILRGFLPTGEAGENQ